MPQLGYPRTGWENENLASYVLSRFSFIASPHSVSDDAGIDFFCTLFLRTTKIKNKRKVEFLIPDNSFGIQIKSNKQRISATKRIQYLSNLEIPYFIGVINREQVSLTLYSGAWIPPFFAYRGHRIKLKLKVSDDEVNQNNYHEEIGERTYLLRFPKVFEISAKETPEDLNDKVKELSKHCSSIHGNIAAKKNRENLYNIPGTEHGVVTVAGMGSAKVFRDNFYKRLTEVFLNLQWSHDNATEQHMRDLIRDEFAIYEGLFLQMQEFYNDLPYWLTGRYQSTREYFENA